MTYTYTAPEPVWRPTENPRYDVRGTCTTCGATYNATGHKDFVDGVVTEFTETHRQIHGKEE